MIDLKQYGYVESEMPENGLIPARVVEQHRSQYIVICPQGEVQAVLKGSFVHEAKVKDDLPCVGDYVFIRYNESGPSLIEKLLPRRTKFSRADIFSGSIGHIKADREQVVAANFDYVFIISSLNHDFNVNRIVRYLTQGWQSGAQPVVILTKADLVENADEFISKVENAASGVPVHGISSHTGLGLEQLEEYLEPEKTIVFLGMSGVGKSSLLNVLMGEDVMAVKAIREDDSRGRHTTTHRQLFMLSSGGMVIDTPGMRELGLYGAEEALSHNFSYIEELFSNCRFSNCSHVSEPDCAVNKALEDGSLPHEQWERYCTQVKEVRFIEDKTEFMREKKEWAKEISKFTKKKKKSGGFKR
ncbi:MAG: ribosome small subunit-dependent GTPase A [Defluviitaleaceae bacterium]|nr:ribosome small subunit-dependent GTPase A [Defluviitaleaceae bacterium]